MTRTTKSRRNTAPLITEPHPDDYNGYPFITLIQYHTDKSVLTIVDNASDKEVQAFVLDLCVAENIREDVVIAVAAEWYGNSASRYPISIEFSRLGLTQSVAGLMRVFNTDYITRVIGPLPSFNMTSITKTRRRKRKTIPEGMELKFTATFAD